MFSDNDTPYVATHKPGMINIEQASNLIIGLMTFKDLWPSKPIH